MILPAIFPALSPLALVLVNAVSVLIFTVPFFLWFVFNPIMVTPLMVEAQQKLQKSEARFRNLADFAPVGIYETDAQGNYIFVNRKWCEIMGLSIDQALGNGWLSAIHPESEQLVTEEWEWALCDGREFMMEYRVRDAINSDKRVFDSAAPFRGEGGDLSNFMGIVIDVTKRHQSETALRESEARFRTMFDHSEDAIILFAPGACTILDVNGTTERLYGYSKDEMIGHDSHLMHAQSECDDCMLSICDLTGSEVRNIDHVVNLKKDGTELHLSVRAKLIKLLGEDVIYCTMRDISPRLQMEKEALALQAQMIHANKMNSLGLLVAGIAHEINNPNNYIMVNAQMLFKIWEDLAPLLKEEEQRNGDFILGGLPYTKLEEALPEMISAINDGSRRIKSIVSALKNYSRKGKSPAEALEINRVVAASLMLFKHHIKKYTDNFVLDLEEGTPRIMGSSQQLEQVIINLVMNALQSLTDRKQRLSLKTSFSPEKQAVLLTVTDEGCGIPDEVKSRIMEPFFTTKIDSGGTGLGLSIARSIVLAHHGEIDIASRSGEGTVVTVSLPVAEKFQEGEPCNV
ncbi:MAG: PAS domain S-box protein [Desulfuromonadaceae bacterium]|nr:PAS domain S-box protein [Desulfuromonadaceae bacterium]